MLLFFLMIQMCWLTVRVCAFIFVGMGVLHERVQKKNSSPESTPTPPQRSVWEPRLRRSVSSAIVLVIVNLGHLPGGISHSSNKVHKTNHKVLRCWLPLIEFWAHKHISKCLTARGWWLACLKYGCHVCLFVRLSDRKPAHLEACKVLCVCVCACACECVRERMKRERRREVVGERQIGGD